jgi:hypothetical protein
MSLKYKIEAEAYEKLDEAQQSFYTEKDGDYVLDVEGAEGEDDVKGLKKALEAEREAARKFQRQLKQAQEASSGIDKEKYEELLAKEQEAEEAAALKAGEFEKLKEQMISKHREELDKWKSEVKRRDSRIEELTIETAVVNELSKAGGNVELLRPHVRRHLKLDSDTLEMVVLDNDGSTPKVDGEGKPATLESLVSEMRKLDTFASAFKATEQSGGGSDPGGDGSSGSTGKAGGTPKLKTEGLKRSEMTDRQKIDYQNEHGLDAFLELPN